MDLVDLLAKLKDLDYSQKKYHVDRQGEYAQLVFPHHSMRTWLDRIGNILGKPVKTADQPVTDTIIRLTEDFGEIFDHQTLFYHEIDGQRIMAMFWPWSNQEYITIKLMILTKD